MDYGTFVKRYVLASSILGALADPVKLDARATYSAANHLLTDA